MFAKTLYVYGSRKQAPDPRQGPRIPSRKSPIHVPRNSSYEVLPSRTPRRGLLGGFLVGHPRRVPEHVAVLVDRAGAEGNDLGFLRLLLGGVRDDDAALDFFGFLDALRPDRAFDAGDAAVVAVAVMGLLDFLF